MGRLAIFSMIPAAVAALLIAPVPVVAQAPGPELFAQDPRNPLELWGAIDYLTRTGQSNKAVPYLDRFQQAEVDDDAYLAIRDRYGVGSVLRLGDESSTRKYAEPIANKLAEAERRAATDPKRLAGLIESLTRTPTEQGYGIARLRQAGSYAIPALVSALKEPGLSAEDRALIVQNMGRLEPSAVPALLAVLDSKDPALAADAATVLGRIGDRRAIPFLTRSASAVDTPARVREAAQAAIGRLTGLPFASQKRSPAQVLIDAARQYHRQEVEFLSDPVAVWVWNDEKALPEPRMMRPHEAETYLGLRLAEHAAKLQPQSVDANSTWLGFKIQDAIDRSGYHEFPEKEKELLDEAVRKGPAVLADVLRKAIADGKDELAGVAATALGKVINYNDVSLNGGISPLVAALGSPSPRTQFAAAKALVELNPSRPFPGSSGVVPTLSRFVSSQERPKAVVIDNNASRGSQLAGSLRTLGYDAVMETDGKRGFLDAVETADVELILVSHEMHRRGSWSLTDTLTNLRSDARTAGVPLYVYGARDLEMYHASLLQNYPGVKFLIQPPTPELLERFIGGRPSRLTNAERTSYAREAGELLAKIVTQPTKTKSPFAQDLGAAEPALTVAINQKAAGQSLATTLGDVPNPDAQRSLADIVLDPTRPAELRRASAAQLLKSIDRFGPLVSAEQEARIAHGARLEGDDEVRSSLNAAVNALRTRTNAGGRPLKFTRPAASEVQKNPAPETVPST